MIAENAAELLATRKLVTVAVSDLLLIQMIRTGYKAPGRLKCLHGIPASGQLVAVSRGLYDTVEFVFYDESFSATPQGKDIFKQEIVMGFDE